MSGRCPVASSASTVRTVGRGDPPQRRWQAVRGWPGRRAAPAARVGSCRRHRRAARSPGAAGGSGRHGLACSWPWSPQLGQLRQKSGSGRVQVAHSGSSRVPPRTGWTVPQPRASRPALFAGAAPRLAGGLGDRAGGRVRQIAQVLVGHGPAAGAHRPVGAADVDRATTAAADADLLVGRVGGQAVRTQRPPVRVAGGRFADRATARARLGTGLGHAVAARSAARRGTWTG